MQNCGEWITTWPSCPQSADSRRPCSIVSSVLEERERKEEEKTVWWKGLEKGWKAGWDRSGVCVLPLLYTFLTGNYNKSERLGLWLKQHLFPTIKPGLLTRRILQSLWPCWKFEDGDNPFHSCFCWSAKLFESLNVGHLSARSNAHFALFQWVFSRLHIYKNST